MNPAADAGGHSRSEVVRGAPGTAKKDSAGADGEGSSGQDQMDEASHNNMRLRDLRIESKIFIR